VLTVVCFKWRNPGGFQLPSQEVTTYSEQYVIKLRNSVARHYRRPHRFVCVTDEPIDDIECRPLWTDYLHMGGCYNRLKIFSPEMRAVLGERFVCVDLDCVITGDLRPVFDRPEDFVMNRYSRPQDRDQHYNGSLILMTAGCRAHVWDQFDPIKSPAAIAEAQARNDVIGTDQAWIRLVLGKSEARFEDRVYDYRHDAFRRLPDDASMVFFSGRRSPETEIKRHRWIASHWV
jgi:hypothetical protein